MSECKGCGSTQEDRKRFLDKSGDAYTEADLEVRLCPHCDGDKCDICDMGDDVGCLACEDED